MPVIQPCVWGMGDSFAFPLAGRLPSPASVPTEVELFGRFVSTMRPSDCQCPYIRSVFPFGFLRRPVRPFLERADTGPPDSRTRCMSDHAQVSDPAGLVQP